MTLVTALFSQTVLSVLTVTIGAGVMVIVMLSDTDGQAPFEVDVNVIVTDPVVLSAAVGV